MKKKCIISLLVLVGAVIILAAFAVKLNMVTPYEYLKQDYLNENDDNKVIPSELLFQRDNFDGENILLFYINNNGNFCSAILKKNFLSYSVLTISSEVSLDNNSYIYSQYGSDPQNGLCWGLIKDKNIKNVLIDNKQCECVEIKDYGFRLFWSVVHYDDQNPPAFKKIYSN